jgi:hypothetical protein
MEFMAENLYASSLPKPRRSRQSKLSDPNFDRASGALESVIGREPVMSSLQRAFL